MIPSGIQNESQVNGMTSAANEEEQMRALIDSLSAYIEHFHGGAVRMVAYDGEVLQVRMSGACDGCSLAPVTLHGWVEGTVKQFFPNLREVQSV